MRFSNIDKYILLGGEILLPELALELRQMGKNVLVVISPRDSKSLVASADCQLDEFLEKNHFEYFVSDDVNKDSNVISEINSGVIGLSIGAAWIFRKEIIDQFAGKLLNIHGAKLPHDRGGGGFSWRILRDNRRGFSLIHQVDTGIDSGPIVKYKEFIYPHWCRVPRDFEQVILEKNQELIRQFIKEVDQGEEFTCMDQPEYLSIYWPRLSTEHHGYVDWSWSLKDIERFICAFDEPYKGASTFVNGKRVFLKNSFVDFSDGVFHPFQNGIVYRKSDNVLFVSTKEGALAVRRVSDEYGEDIAFEINVGDRFYTPFDVLVNAMQYRARYTPHGLE